MTIRLVTDKPAVFITDEKTLVIADLHIGLESELHKKGITIHSQAEKYKKRIDKLIKTTKAKKLIILGDLKHMVPGINRREEMEIPKLLNHLVKKLKVILVIGNHDTDLKHIIPKKVKICSSHGLRIKKYGFFHGHAWPSKELMRCDYLFTAHTHPAIEFNDSFGFRLSEKVWVKGELDGELVKKKYKIRKIGKMQTIIIPTFNNLLGGISINTRTQKEYLGPVLRNGIFDMDKAKIYLLDGTFLGRMESLKARLD